MGYREKFLNARRVGMEITSAQKEYLDVIRRHVKEHGYPPTFREVATALEVSHNAVFEMVCKLERDGYLRIGRMKSRTMTVTQKGWEVP